MDLSHAEFFEPNELRDFSPSQIKALVTSVPPRHTSHIQCVRCNRALPLRLSDVGENAARWLCSRCGLPFAAMCIRDQLAELSALVRLDGLYFDTSNLPQVTPELQAVVARMVEKAEHRHPANRRRSHRVSQSLVVPAVALSAELNPVGDTMAVMVADISSEGIGLVHPRPITAGLIALELRPGHTDPVQVIVKLVRCQPLLGHYYEMGGEFVVRLGHGHVTE